MEPLHFTFDFPVDKYTLWRWITEPDLMKKWMMEEEDSLHIESHFVKDSPIRFSGQLHGQVFENLGVIEEFEAPHVFAYTHKSSLSGLQDLPQHYTRLRFTLSPAGPACALKLELRNFPTFEIYKHLEFYWPVALSVLKKMLTHDYHHTTDLPESGTGESI